VEEINNSLITKNQNLQRHWSNKNISWWFTKTIRSKAKASNSKIWWPKISLPQLLNYWCGQSGRSWRLVTSLYSRSQQSITPELSVHHCVLLGASTVATVVWGRQPVWWWHWLVTVENDTLAMFPGMGLFVMPFRRDGTKPRRGTQFCQQHGADGWQSRDVRSRGGGGGGGGPALALPTFWQQLSTGLCVQTKHLPTPGGK